MRATLGCFAVATSPDHDGRGIRVRESIKSLEGKVPEVYAIGDCARQGLILEAIGDASRVAYGI